MELKNRNRIKELYEVIGELSYCGLYYLPKSTARELVNEIKSNFWKFQTERKINKIIEKETDFFLIDTDFDYHGGERDGEIFHIDVNIGSGLNKKIINILTGTEVNEPTKKLKVEQ